MTQALAAFSTSVTTLVEAAAPLVCTIRTGPNRHVTGLVCYGDTIVAVDQLLPALDSYTVIMSRQTLHQARPESRDAAANLAFLRLERPVAVVNPEAAEVQVGAAVVVVGSDADAGPTARLTIVHRVPRTGNGIGPVLDLPATSVEQGGLVLDAGGRLIGLAAIAPSGEAMVIPSALIGRALVGARAAASGTPINLNARGWLGVSLQPITVPDPLIAVAGQTSGRRVMSVTKGGPAEAAGLRAGDVLLSLNDTNASGPQAMRAFLGPERIGSVVRVKFLRDGVVLAAFLTVAAQPS